MGHGGTTKSTGEARVRGPESPNMPTWTDQVLAADRIHSLQLGAGPLRFRHIAIG